MDGNSCFKWKTPLCCRCEDFNIEGVFVVPESGKVGSTLEDNSKRDRPWVTHRRANVKVGHIYETSEFSRYAERMHDCGWQLEFAEVKAVDDVGMAHDRKLKLMRAHFCRVRNCPICAWRRVMALHARFFKNLPDYMLRNPDRGYLYMVLTVKNPEMEELRKTIRHMNDSLKKMLKRVRVEAVVKGFVKSIEVTKGKDGLPHPHINLCICVAKSYFKNKCYITQKEWTELWKSCLGVDYDPIVYVTRIRKKKRKGETGGEEEENEERALEDGIREVVKYSVKEEDLTEDPQFLLGLTKQIHKLRFYSTGGCMSGLLSEPDRAPTDEVSDVSEDEMLVKTGSEGKITKMRQVYNWGYDDSRHGNYYLRSKYVADDGLDDYVGDGGGGGDKCDDGEG